jgi:hypothetical protein
MNAGSVSVFRPAAKAWARYLGPGTLVFAAISVGISFEELRSPHPSSRAIALLATVAGLGSVMWLYFRNVRLEIDSQTIRVTTFSGRAREWPRSAVRGCARRVVRFRGISVSKPLLIIYGSQNHTLFRLESSLWDSSTISAIQAHLGGGTDNERVVTKKQVIEEFPGALSFLDQHNWLVGCAIPLVAVIAATLLSVLLR